MRHSNIPSTIPGNACRPVKRTLTSPPEYSIPRPPAVATGGTSSSPNRSGFPEGSPAPKLSEEVFRPLSLRWVDTKLGPTGVSQTQIALETQCGEAAELLLVILLGDSTSGRDPPGLEEFSPRKRHLWRPAALCK